MLSKLLGTLSKRLGGPARTRIENPILVRLNMKASAPYPIALASGEVAVAVEGFL
jgi:hypothetical protein